MNKNREQQQKLYAYYKQALQDPPIEKAETPGTFDLKGKAKKRAWQHVVDDGVTPEEAQTKYVALVEEMKEKYGFDDSKAPEPVGGA
jgi:diazepam-binding inhibitor (GABA receptor modulator, acyl-CoA-binding protein)